MACGCNDNISLQPCCDDCAPNPCESGCLDYIDATCIEYTSTLPTCIDIANGSKLDFIIQAIDNEICELQQKGDKHVRISAIDTNSGYLSDKIITCAKLTTSIVTSGGQQKLQICLADDAETPLTAVDSSSISFTTSGTADHTITGLVNVSADAENPIFRDSDGLNINYTTLVTAIVNDPVLLAMICDACNP